MLSKQNIFTIRNSQLIKIIEFLNISIINNGMHLLNQDVWLVFAEKSLLNCLKFSIRMSNMGLWSLAVHTVCQI